jgi:hypothetical protein
MSDIYREQLKRDGEELAIIEEADSEWLVDHFLDFAQFLGEHYPQFRYRDWVDGLPRWWAEAEDVEVEFWCVLEPGEPRNHLFQRVNWRISEGDQEKQLALGTFEDSDWRESFHAAMSVVHSQTGAPAIEPS